MTVWCILPSLDSIKRIKPAIQGCVPMQASDRHFLTMHNGPFFRGKLNHRLHIKKKKKKAHFKITSPLVESVLFAIKVARGSRQSCCEKAAPCACDLHNKKCALEAFQFMKNL